MTFQEKAVFIAAMQIAADERPELFSIKDDAFYFLNSYRLPLLLTLEMGDELRHIAELNEAELEVAA